MNTHQEWMKVITQEEYHHINNIVRNKTDSDDPWVVAIRQYEESKKRSLKREANWFRSLIRNLIFLLSPEYIKKKLYLSIQVEQWESLICPIYNWKQLNDSLFQILILEFDLKTKAEKRLLIASLHSRDLQYNLNMYEVTKHYEKYAIQDLWKNIKAIQRKLQAL